jgi:serine O-acetyltransferase
MLVTDLSRIYRLQTGTRLQRILKCHMLPGFQAARLHRFGQRLERRPKLVRFCLHPLYMFMRYRMWKKWGINISQHATIGEGLLILNFGGIFIGPATIGRICTIRHDTTIGEVNSGLHKGLPVLGNNVDIAPGAVIAGKILVGDNVKIGPNAIVQRNIPDNAVVQLRSVQVVIFPSLDGEGEEQAEASPAH